MKARLVQDAKASFSETLDACLRDRPQMALTRTCWGRCANGNGCMEHTGAGEAGRHYEPRYSTVGIDQFKMPLWGRICRSDFLRTHSQRRKSASRSSARLLGDERRHVVLR
jgi:hypothetical protein